uniref:Uncharacterized protein n=1 Tax=Oryza brachyantha TaxID=4533 RepID=J3LW91_ORYBR
MTWRDVSGSSTTSDGRQGRARLHGEWQQLRFDERSGETGGERGGGATVATLYPSTPHDGGFGPVRLGLHHEEVTEHAEVRRNAEKSLTNINKNKNMKDRIGVDMVEFEFVKIKQAMEEGGNKKTEPSLEEGGEDDDFIGAGEWGWETAHLRLDTTPPRPVWGSAGLMLAALHFDSRQSTSAMPRVAALDKCLTEKPSMNQIPIYSQGSVVEFGDRDVAGGGSKVIGSVTALV